MMTMVPNHQIESEMVLQEQEVLPIEAIVTEVVILRMGQLLQNN